MAIDLKQTGEVPVTFFATRELRERIEDVARENGRTISGEIRYRLAQVIASSKKSQ